jgi:hypothetical protein
MTVEERMEIIKGLEEKRDNITNIISRTDKNSQIYQTYMGIAE